MPPEYVSFPLAEVRKVFKANGIIALEDFPDGQTIWGTEELKGGKYPSGALTMGSEYKPGRYDMDTVTKIVEHLGKSAALPEIKEYLYNHILESPKDGD